MTLVVELERGLPHQLPAGSATAVFCIGRCWDTAERLVRLEILVDGVAHPLSAFGMPRPDRPTGDPAGTPAEMLYSGFWSTVPVTAPSAGGSIVLELRARLATGRQSRTEIGRIEAVAPEPAMATSAQPARAQPETIAVCMATYEPDLALLEVQIESLRSQTDQGWICLISDDGSRPERLEQIRRIVGKDQRFAVSPSERHLGFYRNFERALGMVPASAELIALCDQDDRWHPDKLASLRAGIGDAILVYSDLRLVEADGRLLRDTLWEGRSNNHDSLASMLVANTITGAATLFRRELLARALPFPDTPGFQFHDTWLAVIALSSGRVAYLDRPLYDYVQHPGAVFGDVTHGQRPSAIGPLRTLREWLRAGNRMTAWRAAYFYGYLARQAQAHTVLARCGSTLEDSKHRVLERFVACDHSLLAVAWLALRPARAWLGHTETLGSELGLAQGVVWKMAARTGARHHRRVPTGLADASPPPPQSFSQTRLRRWRSSI